MNLHIWAVYQALYHYRSKVKEGHKYAKDIADGLEQALNQLEKIEDFKKNYFISGEKAPSE